MNPSLVPETNTRVRVFPLTGAAALRHGEGIPFTTWCALALLDPNGSGRISRADARDFIAQWRGIDPASARRILREGERTKYWRAARDREHLCLTGIAELMVRLDVAYERTPRLIPLAAMRTQLQIRAELYAAIHELPGHSQRFRSGPLSRTTKEMLTGVSRTAQKRYDKHSTDLIQICIAEVETDDRFLLEGQGYFIGPGGKQYRRLPDYRAPRDQWLASKTAARHANAKAKRLREALEGGNGDQPPVATFRGRGTDTTPPSPHRRSFFMGSDERSAFEHAPAPVDRGEETILGWGPAGRMQFRIVGRRTKR